MSNAQNGPEPEAPLRVVVTLTAIKGKLVLIERKKPLRGIGWSLNWSFPGGLPKEGETLEKTAVREAKEEVRLDVKVVARLGERKHPRTLVPIVYFACELTDEEQEPEVGEPDEIVRVELVDPMEVLERFEKLGLDVHPPVREHILKLASSNAKER